MSAEQPTGWFLGLKPLHAALLAAVGIAAMAIVSYRTFENIIEAPATVAGVAEAVEALEMRVFALEESQTQMQESIQEILNGLTNVRTTFGDMREMLNELFCDRFPLGSPSGVRCQLAPVPQ